MLGGRLWDLQHKGEAPLQKLPEVQGGLDRRLEEFQGMLDPKLGEIQDALNANGRQILQLKGVWLDLSQQLSAIERKIDLTKPA